MRLPVKFAGTSVAAAVVFSLIIAGPVAAASPPWYTCTGTLLGSPGFVPAGTYAGLTMPAGSLCLVTDGLVSIKHRTSLGTGAGLLVEAAGALTIHGGLTVGRDAAFAADVYGETAPININGPVDIQQGGAFFLGTGVQYGPTVATIRGSFTGDDASAVVIHNVEIRGSVRILGGGGDNAIIDALAGPGGNYTTFEDVRILGSLTETGYQGIWGGVIRTKIWGGFTFSHNVQPASGAGEYDIGSNVIFGSAKCDDNSPAPNLGDSPGFSSIVHGATRGDQGDTCTGVPGGVTGPPPS